MPECRLLDFITVAVIGTPVNDPGVSLTTIAFVGEPVDLSASLQYNDSGVPDCGSRIRWLVDSGAASFSQEQDNSKDGVTYTATWTPGIGEIGTSVISVLGDYYIGGFDSENPEAEPSNPGQAEANIQFKIVERCSVIDELTIVSADPVSGSNILVGETATVTLQYSVVADGNDGDCTHLLGLTKTDGTASFSQDPAVLCMAPDTPQAFELTFSSTGFIELKGVLLYAADDCDGTITETFLTDPILYSYVFWTEEDTPNSTWAEENTPNSAWSEENTPNSSWSEENTPNSTWTEENTPDSTWAEE